MRLLPILALFPLAALGSSSVSVLTNWVLPTERNFSLLPQERTTPVVFGDTLYLGRLTGELTAVHRVDGYVLWRKQLSGPIDGCLSFARSKIFVGDTNGTLYALNARDGSEIWKYKARSEWLAPVATPRDYVVAQSSDSLVVALSESTGKELWQFSHRGDEKMSVRGTSSPAVFANTDVLVGFSDGFAVSLSLATGAAQWEKRLRVKERFYDIEGSPLVDELSVTFSTYDGRTVRLNRLTGETEWTFGVGSYGGFLVEGDTLYFSGLDGVFYALDKNLGAVKWTVSIEGGFGLTPVRVGKWVVVSTAADPVHVIDPEAKRVVATVSLGTGALSSISAGNDGSWYVVSNYGNVFSFTFSSLVSAFDFPAIHCIPTAVERYCDRSQPKRPA